MRAVNRSFGGTLVALAVLVSFAGPIRAESQIDFGNDTSEWANDGECDDPRFQGAGMASELEDVDLMKDATDCRTAFEAGTITLVETATEAPATAAATDEIDFGDDSGDWAKDGECDDPRFTGSAMAEELLDADIKRDATDCRTAFDAGTITYVGETGSTDTEIDFGDDSSEWANDQECDDPRFVGTGMASDPLDENIRRDATDCRNAYEDGTIRLDDGTADTGNTDTGGAGGLAAIANRIDFGDDSGDWPKDGECDDPDFVGSGMASDPYDANRLGDATDCRAAFIAGTISLKSGDNTAAGGFDYGTDSSRWSNDGQCDDMRFTGAGMAKKLESDDIRGDATDCRMLEEAGEISIKPVYTPEYAAGAPYDSSEIDFGDDSSDYAKDDQCDDPRFEGPGVASIVLDDDRMSDATDCKAAFEAGTAVLIEGES